jgi:ferrous iron transport protein B
LENWDCSLTSFAAREVFVGTLATIYSVGGSDNEHNKRIKWLLKLTTVTGRKSSTSHQGIPIVVLCFALQCASTLAMARNQFLEWPGQLIFMSGLLTLWH